MENIVAFFYDKTWSDTMKYAIRAINFFDNQNLISWTAQEIEDKLSKNSKIAEETFDILSRLKKNHHMSFSVQYFNANLLLSNKNNLSAFEKEIDNAFKKEFKATFGISFEIYQHNQIKILKEVEKSDIIISNDFNILGFSKAASTEELIAMRQIMRNLAKDDELKIPKNYSGQFQTEVNTLVQLSRFDAQKRIVDKIKDIRNKDNLRLSLNYQAKI